MQLSPSESRIRILDRASRVDQRLMVSHSRIERYFLRWRRFFLPYYFARPPMRRILLRAAVKRERMTPSFASLGAVRSGTSLFSDYLMQHPCVVLPLAKEISVTGIPVKRLIEAQFPTRREQRKVEALYGAGRAITGYCTPAVPQLAFPQIAAGLAPDLRILLLLRDPVDRTFAHWRWDQAMVSRFRRDPFWQHFPDFDECMRLELDSIRSNGGGMTPFSGTGGGGYLQHSIYLPFLKNLRRFFGRERVLVLNAQDFFADPPKVAKTAYRFLGLPDFEPAVLSVKNAGPPGVMGDSTREALLEFFRPLNQELYRHVDQDFGWQ
jgi:hypothetical protein